MSNVSKFSLFGETVNVKDSNARDRITSLEDERLTEVVWIGDSFSTGFQPGGTYLSKSIPMIVSEMLGLNLHNYGNNASGFTVAGDGQKTFLSEVQEAVADVSYNHEKVKYVVILGGINDVNNNPSGDVYGASVTLLNAIKVAFTKAIIYYIPNWGAVSLPDNQEIIFKKAGSLHDGDIGSTGFVYGRNNLTSLMGYPNLVNTDNIHPTQAGAYHMAASIFQIINGSNNNNGYKVSLTPGNGWDISGLNMYRSTDKVRIYGYVEAAATITPSNNTIAYIPSSGTFSGTVYTIQPSHTANNVCTIEIVPSVALTDNPTAGTIKMFYDHGITFNQGDNVLINIEIPLLNY